MSWCDNCGKVYEADGSGSHCCPDCRISVPAKSALPRLEYRDGKVVLIGQDGLEVQYACAVCGAEMEVNPEKVIGCVFCQGLRGVSAGDPPRLHVHVRCRGCSPEWWHGAVMIAEEKA